MTWQERRRCTVAKHCHNKGDPVLLPWRPIAVEVAPLLSDASTSQLLCSVLLHHHLVIERDCIPCSDHQQKKMTSGASTDRESGVVRNIRQAVRLPVMLLVSVWSLQVSSLCCVFCLSGFVCLPGSGRGCVWVSSRVSQCAWLEQTLFCAPHTLCEHTPLKLWPSVLHGRVCLCTLQLDP